MTLQAQNSLTTSTVNRIGLSSGINSGNPKSQTYENEDPECFICKNYVRPVSYTWLHQTCGHRLHISYIEKQLGVELLSEKLETMEAWRCPECYKDPLQDISDQLSEDKSRHPGSKRAFGEMVKFITHDDDIGKTRISISRQLR